MLHSPCCTFCRPCITVGIRYGSSNAWRGEREMSEASRVKRWRDNKRQQGFKHVSVWLTPEEELRLKDLALHWHCSPSQVMQRALLQLESTTALEHSSPTDTSLIRELIREELAAMQTAQGHVAVGYTVGGTLGYTVGGTVVDTVGGTVGDTVDPTVLPTETYAQDTAPSEACPDFDPTKNVLGRLCPRGHEWGTTGKTLRRLP